MKFDPAYTVLTASAAYPSLINKKDARNSNANIAPSVITVKDAVYTWHNEKQWPRFVTVNESASVSSSTTTITVDDASSIVPKMQLKVASTGEQLTVTSVSGNDITVQRAPASTSATNYIIGQTLASTILQNDTLEVLGTSLYDMDTASDMRSTVNTDEFENYVQIFDVTYKLSEQAEYFEFMGGPVRIRLSERGAREASYNLEDTFVYGEPSKTVSTTDASNVRYTMRGLLNAIKTYTTDSDRIQDLSGAALTFDFFMAFENQFEADGTDTVYYLASKDGLGYFDKWGQTYVRTTPVENKLGINITEVKGTTRTIRLVHLPALDKKNNKVALIRFNPVKNMKILQARPWQYKECDKDKAQNWTTHWLHGEFSAKFDLISETAGMIGNIAKPYSLS